MIAMKYFFLILFFPLMTALAQAGGTDMNWEESAQFGVRINGKLDISSRVYQPTDYRPLIILRSEKLKTPLLLDLGKKSVLKIKAVDLKEQDSFLFTKGIPSGKKTGSYKLVSGETTFRIDGKKITIRIRPTLVGKVTEEVILAHSPDYAIRKNAYKPKKKSINALRKYKKKTQIVVLFATWCSTCKDVLPPVLRVLEDAGNRKFSLKMYGISMGGNEPRAALKRYGHDYPVVIFLQNGKELDRIIGEPVVPMEDAFLNILK